MSALSRSAAGSAPRQRRISARRRRCSARASSSVATFGHHRFPAQRLAMTAQRHGRAYRPRQHQPSHALRKREARLGNAAPGEAEAARGGLREKDHHRPARFGERRAYLRVPGDDAPFGADEPARDPIRRAVVADFLEIGVRDEPEAGELRLSARIALGRGERARARGDVAAFALGQAAQLLELLGEQRELRRAPPPQRPFEQRGKGQKAEADAQQQSRRHVCGEHAVRSFRQRSAAPCGAQCRIIGLP